MQARHDSLAQLRADGGAGRAQAGLRQQAKEGSAEEEEEEEDDDDDDGDELLGSLLEGEEAEEVEEEGLRGQLLDEDGAWGEEGEEGEADEALFGGSGLEGEEDGEDYLEGEGSWAGGDVSGSGAASWYERQPQEETQGGVADAPSSSAAAYAALAAAAGAAAVASRGARAAAATGATAATAGAVATASLSAFELMTFATPELATLMQQAQPVRRRSSSQPQQQQQQQQSLPPAGMSRAGTNAQPSTSVPGSSGPAPLATAQPSSQGSATSRYALWQQRQRQLSSQQPLLLAAPQLACIAWCLDTLDYLPPPEWMSRFVDRAEACLPAADAAEVADLVQVCLASMHFDSCWGGKLSAVQYSTCVRSHRVLAFWLLRSIAAASVVSVSMAISSSCLLLSNTRFCKL